METDTYRYMKEFIQNKGYVVTEDSQEIIVEKKGVRIIYRKENDDCLVAGIMGSFVSSPMYIDCLNLFKAYRKERCLDVC